MKGTTSIFTPLTILFLDMLVKGGMGTLTILVVELHLVVRLAVRAVKTGVFGEEANALTGVGWVLLSFWPPFIVINLVR